jgi:prephenate dehydrogenase
VHFRKITIVGVGLLGGSLGLVARKRRLSSHVVGFVRRASSLGDCKKYRVVDSATRDLASAVENADLIVLCTPLAQMPALVREMIPSLKRGAIVTDVGSVKAGVVREVESLIHKAGAHFIGSHPLAGAEKTGVSAARVDLFENAVCVVTPTKRSNAAAVRKVEQFWSAVGGRVVRLTSELHDVLVSRSSHLPHILAALLADLVLDPAAPKQQALLCANGFRDTTRIASGSPEMWRDIAVSNRTNLIRALDRFAADLKKFRRALQRSDTRAVSRLLESAKRRRDDWRAHCVSSSPE